MNRFYGELSFDNSTEGCFTKFDNATTKNTLDKWGTNYGLSFDASLSNEKYTSDTIQPASSYALIIIKA